LAQNTRHKRNLFYSFTISIDPRK